MLQIYDVSAVAPRQVVASRITDIVSAHEKKDHYKLVTTLLQLDKFPIDDIYVGFMRQYKDAPKLNRKTVERISKRLLAMPVEDVIKLCRQPMVDNRRMGELFHNWLLKLPYPKLDEDSFLKLEAQADLKGKKSSVLMLDGSRKDFRDFANRHLGCGLEKELDILFKVKGQYIIGEAKFFSGFGGHQNDQFLDAVDNFLLKTQGNATRIAVLDGVVWLDGQNKMCLKIRRQESLAMSALLLQDFITSI